MEDAEKLLNECRDRVRHESGLMLSRLTTLLSSQSFLLIAYATSMASAHGHWSDPFTLLIPPVLAALGIALAWEGRSGIRAARDAARRWQDRSERLIDEHPTLPHWRGVPSEEISAGQRAGEVFPLRAPLIFIAAWCWFVALPIALFIIDRR